MKYFLLLLTLLASFTETPCQSYSLNRFTVAVTNVSSVEIVITSTDTNTVQWAATSTFFACSKVTPAFTEGVGGVIVVRDTIEYTSDSLTVNSVSATASSVSLIGSLWSTSSPSTLTPTPFSCTFSVTDIDSQLAITCQLTNSDSDSDSDSELSACTLYYHAVQNETFTGLGLQYTHVTLNGYKVPIMAREQGIGRGVQPLTATLNTFGQGAGGDSFTTYSAIPHYLTSKFRSLFLLNSEYSVFDFTSPSSTSIFVNSTSLRLRLISSSSVSPISSIISSYTSYVGRQRRLPSWITSGVVVGMQGGQALVMKAHAELMERNCPVAAYWLQDWVGQINLGVAKQLYWNWEVDPAQYPSWSSLISNFRASNIRTMVYLNPMLRDVSHKTPVPLHNYYAEALSKGYVITTPSRSNSSTPWLNYGGALVDLTNKDAVVWLKNIIITNVLKANISGYMADYSEGLPLDAVLANTVSDITRFTDVLDVDDDDTPSQSPIQAHELHNRYPELWLKLHSEIVDELGLQDEVVYFSRAASTGSLKYTSLSWVGDQLTSWDEYDGIKSAVTSMITSGLSGFGYTHSDIGGYTDVNAVLIDYYRSKSLFFRWCELSAFTTVYRTHDGSQPAANWQFYTDNATLDHFVRMAKVYEAWTEYRQQLVDEYQNGGLPVVRSLIIHYPDDPVVWTLSLEYMIGDVFIVAPALDDNIDQVSLYVPEADNGLWRNLWTDEVVKTGHVVVDAPTGKPPVLYKSSAAATAFISRLDASGLRS